MNKVSIPQSFEQIAQPPRSVPHRPKHDFITIKSKAKRTMMNKVSIPQSFEQIAQPPRSVPPQTETRFHHHQEQSKKDYSEQSLHTSEF
jgi:hypothetical protein